MGTQLETDIPVNENVSINYIRGQGVFVLFYYFTNFVRKIPRWLKYIRVHAKKIKLL